MEDQLRQSKKMETVGTLSGGIAHEFNNMLSIILGNMELAREDTSDFSPVQQFLNEIRKAGLRGKEIVHQLLSFSKPYAQKKDFIHLCSIIKEMVDEIESSVSGRIAFKATLNGNCSKISGDPSKLRQVVNHLLTNAIQALKDKPGIIEIDLDNLHIHMHDDFFNANLPPGDYVAQWRHTDKK
ncbi:MAG: hypothetical protein KJ737_18450 [Proteobacteria bacterium]|nr:hypothetical protein [Pseudomonadota bacterium]